MTGKLFGLLVASGLVLLWLGFRIDALGRWEALAIAFGFAPLVVLRAALPLREIRGPVRVAGIAVAVVAVLAVEMAVVEETVPPAPYGVAHLDTDHPDAEIDVPPSVARLALSVHGELPTTGTGKANYVVQVSRGDLRRRIDGKLSREIRKGRRFRRSAPASMLVLHETDVHELDLDDDSAVQLHLVSARGAGLARLDVSLARQPWGRVEIPFVLLAVACAAVLVQALAAKSERGIPLAAGVGAVAVFGEAFVANYNPDQPYTFVVGAALLAVIGAGLGWLLGALASRLTSVRNIEVASVDIES